MISRNNQWISEAGDRGLTVALLTTAAAAAAIALWAPPPAKAAALLWIALP